MGGGDEEVRENTGKLPNIDLLFMAVNHKSHDKVMVVGSEEEDDVVTLDESSITSLLAGAGVTITRTSGPAGSSSSTPRTKPATTTRVGIHSRSKSGRPAHLAPSDPLSQQQPRPAQVFLWIVFHYNALCSAPARDGREESRGGGPTGPWRRRHGGRVWQDR